MTDQAYFNSVNRLRDRIAAKHTDSIASALNRYAIDNQSQAIEEAIESLYVDTFNRFYRAYIEAKAAPQLLLERIKGYVRNQLLEPIIGIKNYTRKLVANNAKRVWQRMNKLRAKVIATTESVTASNEAIQQSGEFFATKTWITRNDIRVRSAHQALHRNSVQLEARWNMSGYYVRYPGDPALPPRLRVGCRCVIKLD